MFAFIFPFAASVFSLCLGVSNFCLRSGGSHVGILEWPGFSSVSI